jgi:hypothetical protein
MSLDGAITNLASWAGNTIMPTMAGLFFAGAVYRYSKGAPCEQFLACPANLVPASMRETGMRGAWNGKRKEAYAGADRWSSAAD